MRQTAAKLKNFLYRTLFKDSFNRDLLTLLLVSIIIGSLLATSVSYAANAYFSKTLASLVGDYGEYDLLIQSREEIKDDTAVHLQKIIDENFPGARLKEGPTITGKTNFFIALPEQYKTKQTYEDLGRVFGGIPGGAGVGTLTEPRLTIRGVPEGAKNMLMERIEQLDGVRFTFHDGGSVGVILTALDKASPVSEHIKELLKQYQVIEISFPVGSEPANPIRLGDNIAADLRDNLKLDYAQNVSVDGTNNDMTYMVSTMMELKKFLQAYATQVTLTPADGIKFTKGEILVFQGSAAAPPAAGAAPDSKNILVEITAVRADGRAEGVIAQGDAANLANNQGYQLEQNIVGHYAGTAAYRNPRQELSGALTETAGLVGRIPGLTQDAQSMDKIALNALDSYDNSLNIMQQTLTNVQAAGTAIQSATNGLANINTGSIQGQLDNSSRAIGGLLNTMQVIKLVSPDASASVDSLNSTRQGLDNLRAGVAAIANISADARRAKSAVDNVVDSGRATITTLRSFDTDSARINLLNVNNRLDQLSQLNTPLIAGQLQYMAAAAPNLRDEEINHSVKLLDKFIAGQVIPGARIQILTTSNISTEAVAPTIYNQVGHNNVSLYSTALGVIEPNPRGELLQVLNEVKAVLAGLTAIVMTVLFLALDHTAVMSAIRRKRLKEKVKPRGWRAVAGRFIITFTAPERRYGMAAGAILLTAMFILARGGIPYLPWLLVPVLGAFIGLLVANYAEKISPVSVEEVMAGESLGLSFDEVMREIVVPCGRPGLLQKLNRRKLKFK